MKWNVDPRVNEMVKRDRVTECWDWTGTKVNGYGVMSIGGETVRIHRYMYEKYKGEISEGLFILHKCDNPSCVNPKHLYAGNHQNNMDDKTGRDRCAKGSAHGMSKLSEQDVLEIREKFAARGFSKKSLSILFEVTPATISAVILRKSWAHI